MHQNKDGSKLLHIFFLQVGISTCSFDRVSVAWSRSSGRRLIGRKLRTQHSVVCWTSGTLWPWNTGDASSWAAADRTSWCWAPVVSLGWTWFWYIWCISLFLVYRLKIGGTGVFGLNLTLTSVFVFPRSCLLIMNSCCVSARRCELLLQVAGDEAAAGILMNMWP